VIVVAEDNVIKTKTIDCCRKCKISMRHRVSLLIQSIDKVIYGQVLMQGINKVNKRQGGMTPCLTGQVTDTRCC
jgi:hypothetical protein